MGKEWDTYQNLQDSKVRRVVLFSVLSWFVVALIVICTLLAVWTISWQWAATAAILSLVWVPLEVRTK